MREPAPRAVESSCARSRARTTHTHTCKHMQEHHRFLGLKVSIFINKSTALGLHCLKYSGMLLQLCERLQELSGAFVSVPRHTSHDVFVRNSRCNSRCKQSDREAQESSIFGGSGEGGSKGGEEAGGCKTVRPAVAEWCGELGFRV
jgi:hypothetical protein